jgi:glycosyltransferase involved in cell wall biosynthesis
MVKNEKDILEAFCAHALSLFDRIILIDHLSTDGTGEYIKLLSQKYPAVEYYLFEDPGYYQSELMTWVAKNLVDNQIPGWVFFLDADEFLPFKSKEEFHLKLFELDSVPLIFMPWLNLVPLDMESGRVIGGFFLKPSIPSPLHKIAFQPNLIAPDDYVVGHGNHALVKVNKRGKKKFPRRIAFSIYHLPIRTKQQLYKKILNGVESYKRMGSDRIGTTGFHWDEIYRIMETKNITNALMAGIITKYSQSLSPPYERDLDELKASGYTEIGMDACFSPLTVSFCDIEFNSDKARRENIGLKEQAANQSNRSYRITFNSLTRSIQLNK